MEIYMKKIVALFLSLFVLLSFPSCGAGSQSEAHFPGNTPVPETASLSPSPSSAPIPEPAQLSAAYDADFTTDDGLIAVSIHDPDADLIPSAMPVLRAVPQEITSDMARQMAEAVFGDATFFEYSEELSKAEIAEMIKVWEDGVLDESILEDYGTDAPQYVIDDVRDTRLEILEFYRNAYAYARDEITPIPCQWKFWPVGHYVGHGFDYAGTDPSYTSSFPFGESVDLMATATVGGVPYVFSAANYDRGDFRNHSLSIYPHEPDSLYSGSSGAEETKARRIAWNTSLGLCSPEPATAQQLESACAWAEKLAADMGLGEFQFTAEAVDRTEHFGGWQIELYGLPIYQGFPVCRRNAAMDRIVDAMYDELFYIITNNDGTLVNLKYTSPFTVMEAEPAALMDAGQTSSAAESVLRSFDYFDLAPYLDETYLNAIGAELSEGSLALDSVRVGYTRIADGSSAYLLVPSIVYSGKAEIIGTGPGAPEPRDLLELYLFGDNPYGPFLSLDLRDGSRLY